MFTCPSLFKSAPWSPDPHLARRILKSKMFTCPSPLISPILCDDDPPLELPPPPEELLPPPPPEEPPPEFPPPPPELLSGCCGTGVAVTAASTMIVPVIDG